MIIRKTPYETIQTRQFKFDHGVDSVVQEILMSISFHFWLRTKNQILSKCHDKIAINQKSVEAD